MVGRQPEHAPVMLAEVLHLLQCRPGGLYVDATAGLGGHSLAILESIQPTGLLIAIDRDKESLDRARQRLEAFARNVRFFHENFKNLPLIMNNLSVGLADGILVDLGASSYQLLDDERGFSFQSDAELDMRMDRRQRLTARQLVNELTADELADLIFRYGEERLSHRIAGAIVRARKDGPIARCSQLADIVARVCRTRGAVRVHPATRTFQALRIAVNQELEGLEEFLRQAALYLRPGGRLLVIAFHSLEDRIVKNSFRMLSGKCVCNRPGDLCICPREDRARLLTPRALRPGPAELASNPRARSARLRAIERL
jgi:16S rRNA (cytosine1402-N4)-methyltransferase